MIFYYILDVSCFKLKGNTYHRKHDERVFLEAILWHLVLSTIHHHLLHVWNNAVSFKVHMYAYSSIWPIPL